MTQPLEFLERYGTSFPAWSLADSRRYTRELAKEHYENFLVASAWLPRQLRQDYCNVYAYCRWADDLADETGEPGRALELLAWWKKELLAMRESPPSHPVFVALRDTAIRRSLPTEDFADLLRAFEQDQTVRRYASYDQLLEYCRYSANPVGRLVLRLNGCEDETCFPLSDATCTALQLANHWQDIGRDWKIGRLYVPEDVMRAHGSSPAVFAEDLAHGTASRACRDTLRDLVDRAAALFAEGLPLADRFGGRFGLELELFSRFGMAVLEAIRAQGWDTISRRPTIPKSARAVLLLRVVARRAVRAR